MSSHREQNGAPFLPGVLTFCACMAVDALVSVVPGFQWPATVYLVQEAYRALSAASSAPQHYSGPAVIMLVALAWCMYGLAGYAVALGMGLQNAHKRSSTLASEELTRAGSLVNRLFKSSAQLSPEEALLQPYERYQAAMRLAPKGGLMGYCWRRIQPRDLLGLESLIDAMSTHLEIYYQPLSLRIEQLYRLGDMAATLGLAGTVLGLIVGGKDLTSPTMVGPALQAALIKTFVGFSIKLFTLYLGGRVLHSIDGTRAELQRALADGYSERSRRDDTGDDPDDPEDNHRPEQPQPSKRDEQKVRTRRGEPRPPAANGRPSSDADLFRKSRKQREEEEALDREGDL